MRWSRLLVPEAGVLLFVGVFAVGAVFASVLTPSPLHLSPPFSTSGEGERGEQVFLREGCAFCHSLSGYQPPPQAVAPGFVGYLQRLGTKWLRAGPDLALEPGKRTDDWHLAHLINPQAVDPGCPMPSYAGLPDDDLRALIAFIQTPRDTPLPGPPPRTGEGDDGFLRVPPTRASYLAGREIYRVYCAGCHGIEGNGAGPVGHLLLPEPRDFTDAVWMSKRSDAYLLGVIGRGKPGTAMPGYDDVLTSEEQALVLYYLRFYTNPSARQSMEEGFVTGEGQP